MATEKAKRFYVYRVLDSAGLVIYIGKGTGKRMYLSLKERGGTTVEAIKHFCSENAAYKYECKLIAKLVPKMNKVAGHSGPSKPRQPLKDKFDKELERIGSRAMAARILLRFWHPHLGLDNANLPEVRRIAYG